MQKRVSKCKVHLWDWMPTMYDHHCLFCKIHSIDSLATEVPFVKHILQIFVECTFPLEHSHEHFSGSTVIEKSFYVFEICFSENASISPFVYAAQLRGRAAGPQPEGPKIETWCCNCFLHVFQLLHIQKEDVQIEVYQNSTSWLSMYQSWAIDTEVHQRPISAPSTNSGIPQGLVVYKTQRQEPPKGEIVPRFLKDPRSLFLVVYTQLLGFVLFDVTLNISYFSVARPFCMKREIRASLPDVLPKRLIINNHHRVGIQDQEFQSMFMIGNLYKTFRVLQSPGMIEPAMLRTYGARLMRTRDPHWTIMSTFLQKETTAKHDLAIAIFPDRDGQLSDNDSHIGFGLGSFATSLALRVPILDICTQILQDEDPGCVYIKSDLLHDLLDKFAKTVPAFSGSKDDQSKWRTQQASHIQAYACEAKQRFLDNNVIQRPMCPIDFHPKNHALDVGRMARNDNMHNRQKCQVPYVLKYKNTIQPDLVEHPVTMSMWSEVLSNHAKHDRSTFAQYGQYGFTGQCNQEESLRRCFEATKDILKGRTLMQLGHWVNCPVEAPFFLAGCNPYLGMTIQSLKRVKSKVYDHRIVLQLVYGDRDVLEEPIFETFSVDPSAWTVRPEKNVSSAYDSETPLLVIENEQFVELSTKGLVNEAHGPTKQCMIYRGSEVVFRRCLSKKPQVWSVHIIVDRDRFAQNSDVFQSGQSLWIRKPVWCPLMKTIHRVTLSNDLKQFLDEPTKKTPQKPVTEMTMTERTSESMKERPSESMKEMPSEKPSLEKTLEPEILQLYRIFKSACYAHK